MKYLVLAILILPFGASADAVFTRTPSGDGVYQYVTYTVTPDDPEIVCLNNVPGSTYWTVESTIPNIQALEQYPLTQKTGIFTLYASQADDQITQIVASCDNSQGSLGNVEYNGGSQLYTLSTNAPPPGIWGYGNGFWGEDFNTVDIKDSLQASVQATGLSIWPLLYLVGVPLAFAIAYYLLDFLYYSIYRGQTSKISSQSPYLDKMVYRPYKGYNRLRSRAWNRKNTMG